MSVISNEVIKVLQILDSDDIDQRIEVMKTMDSIKVMNKYIEIDYDMTKVLCSNMRTMNKELLIYTLKTVSLWIECLLTHTPPYIKSYDMLMNDLNDCIYYASDSITEGYTETLLSHSIQIIQSSHIYIIRHLSKLINGLTYLIEDHTAVIADIVVALLNYTLPIDYCNDMMLVMYCLYVYGCDKEKLRVIGRLMKKEYESNQSAIQFNYLNDNAIDCKQEFRDLFE